MSLPNDDHTFLRLALDEAKKCTPVQTAYSVGCLIVDPITRQILAKGYSRELEGNTHAEENALTKLLCQGTASDRIQDFKNLDMYSTMEPCSERLSGKKSCTDCILEAKGVIARVVLGVREPDKFVRCVGVEKLQENGVVVVRCEDKEFTKECLEVARSQHYD
jgi:pyrimidine deaminase RibD-like protein